MAGGAGGVKGGVNVEFFPADTRNLTQRPQRTERRIGYWGLGLRFKGGWVLSDSIGPEAGGWF